MRHFMINARLTVVAGVCLLCGAIALADKPDNPGGGRGGGGDETAPYTIVPFSPPGVESTASSVHDFNEQGQAVGSVSVDNASQAVHLDIVTGAYTLVQGVSAIGVNNFNQIVGEEEDFVATFWAGPSAQPIRLPPLAGHILSRAIAINDAGIVVGWSEDGVNGTWDSIGVVWRVVVDDDGAVYVNGPQPLGPLVEASSSTTVDVNEVIDGTAQATGYSFNGAREATVWTIELNADGTLAVPGPPKGLGGLGLLTPTWSEGYAINNFGDVCGFSDQWPFIAPAGSGALPLPLPEGAEATGGWAWDVNDAGHVVGSLAIKKRRNSTHGVDHAYLWSGGEVIDLATQIDGKSGWESLRQANQISNSGVIAGQGVLDVNRRGFLMLPNDP